MSVYYAYDCTPYLQHHGILGQRKGVRRFQNPDGSLTPEGRIRYGVGQSEKRRNFVTGEGFIPSRKENLSKAGINYDDKEFAISKGSKMTRFTNTKDEPVNAKRKYGSFTEDDEKYWDGDFRYSNYEYKIGDDGHEHFKVKDIYKDTYEVSKNLRVAGRDAVVNEVLKEIGDKPLKQAVNDLERSGTYVPKIAAEKFVKKYGDVPLTTIWNSWEGAKDPTHMDDTYFMNVNKMFDKKNEIERQAAFGNRVIRLAINNAWAFGAENRGISSKIEENFRKQGYDAIFDPNASFLDMPVIVLNPKKTLKKKDSKKIKGYYKTENYASNDFNDDEP